MKVDKTDYDSIMAAELLPSDVFTVKIVGIREAKPTQEYLDQGGDPEEWESPWCFAQCEIVSAEDPELNTDEIIGRRIDFNLINEYRGRQGLHSLIKHKVLYNPDEGWQLGVPEDSNGDRRTENLLGVEFVGKIRTYESKKGMQQEIRPLIYK